MRRPEKGNVPQRKEKRMKVLLINGSANREGCTYTALSEVGRSLAEEGIETEDAFIGRGPVRDCCGCRACLELGGLCVFRDDAVNDIIRKAREADGFVFGTPVYYAHPSGRLLSCMDRLFYAGGEAFRHKPAAAVASARRAGTTAALDAVAKHFLVNEMPVVASNYWNMVHGNTPEEVRRDAEGMQIMRVLGKNMAWLLKCIRAGRAVGIGAPETESKIYTNFIRNDE